MLRSAIRTLLGVSFGALALAVLAHVVPRLNSDQLRWAGVLCALAGLLYVALHDLVYPRFLKLRRRTGAVVGLVSILTVGSVAWWGMGRVLANPPSIIYATLTATPESEEGNSFISVENTGGTPVEVWADIQILAAVGFPEGLSDKSFRGFWENSRAATTTLRAGQRDRLVLGTVGSGVLQFTYYDPNTSQPAVVAQDRKQTSEAPSLYLGIAVRSDPPTAAKMMGRYWLTSSGLNPPFASWDTIP